MRKQSQNIVFYSSIQVPSLSALEVVFLKLILALVYYTFELEYKK